MDAGMEVIYTGLRQTPGQIVEAAVQEDVDVIAMSILSGAHDYLFPKVMELLKEKGVEDILVIGGGIIPDEDIPALKACGIAEIFGPGTNKTSWGLSKPASGDRARSRKREARRRFFNRISDFQPLRRLIRS
jgi:methylmalonyl-CoA mutase cobalamin-binding domain/chain